MGISYSQDKLTSEQIRSKGEAIYRESCADCHGEQGQGVESAYEVALTGDDSVGQLAELIADTMPEGSPEECQGEEAAAVAEYIHYAFYSEAAQIRRRPPRIAMTRLTGNQLRQSISDLYARFEGLPQPTREQGVRAVYYDGDRRKNENKKIERVDPQINFDFGHESPGEGIEPKAFNILWRGGIVAEASGRYEIVVRSTCSFLFDLGRNGRQFIDNHVQSGDKTEFRKTVSLTAGRAYPFEIQFIQRSRKTELPPARIELAWVPPGGIERTIPTRNLTPNSPPATFALQTILPPDDRSYGYERGIAVTPEWDASTTAAAIEFAQIAYDELWPDYQRSNRGNKDEDRSKLRNFLGEILETATRRPLSPELKTAFIDRQVAMEADDGEAIKRVLLIALKSPRFLYPTADLDASVSQRAANRVALTLFDSLPSDKGLRKLVAEDEFKTIEAVRAYAEQAVDDYRVRAKTRDFLYGWLNIEDLGEVSKDSEHYAQFTPEVTDDLKLSLDAFLDAIVWTDTSDYRQFFLADWAFTTPRIADVYKDALQPIEALEGLSRTGNSPALHGVLTHPLLLSKLAYHDSTSPIHRGVFLIRYMLGRTLRPPSEAFTPLSPDLHPDLTTRERVALQTSPESCQVCHSKINGLGFALEKFDAIGMVREMERGKVIDASGRYISRAGELVEFDSVDKLAEFLANSDDAHHAFVSRAFQHFVKQPPAAYGPETLAKLTERFRENQFSIQKLIVDIAVISAQPVLVDDADQVALGE